MQIVMTIVIAVFSILLIASVLLQEGKNAGMGGSVGGGSESLFGKNQAKGLQALLQKVTVVSGTGFMLSIFIFGVFFA